MRVSRHVANALFGLLVVLCLGVSAAAGDEKLAELPALAANINETSVSGISSGAYMAGQFEIAHSSIVAGAAIIAGGPYGCAESVFADMMWGPGAAFLNMSKAINGCMLNALAIWGVPNPELLAEKTKELADDGRIDPLDGLKNDRVYLFSGSNDHTVVPAIVASAVEYYKLLGLSGERIEYVTNLPAGHAFVTEGEGLSCESTGKPYVVDCDYDQAGAVLKHIYGDLTPRAPAASGTFLAFDQKPFFGDFNVHGMADDGVAYIPASCAARASCRVHIAFHGCAQNETAAGDAFIKESGFARWADTNDLIVLFPQVTATPLNPQGCWDWWGYTGRDYLTRDAPQITIVYRMLERLARPRS